LSDLTSIDRYIYFALTVANNSVYEVWRSDGTPDGTQRIAEQTTTEPTPNGAEFVGVGGDVYFGSGGGLWRLPAGATTATQLTTSRVYALTSLGDRVMFLTTTGLWKTDGTRGGTVQVKRLEDLYFTRTIVNLGGFVYFRGDSSQLYRSDGSAAGTVPAMGSSQSGPPLPYVDSTLVVVGDRLFFFRATEATLVGGDDLWTSDGTAARPSSGSTTDRTACDRTWKTPRESDVGDMASPLVNVRLAGGTGGAGETGPAPRRRRLV
jgi:ELWxxDGT repeat protein